jgi:hypothetical protein
MADFDRGFKEVARQAGRELARLAGIDCDRWSPLVSEVQMAERFADRAFLARRGRERFVVYFEAYTRWDRHAPWNLLTKTSLLAERERLPVQPVLFILQPRGYQSQGGQFRLAVAGAPTQQLWFREVPLWREVPQPWWEDVPGLMTLYPLCHHGRRPREALEHAARVIRDHVPVRAEQADALFVLSIFSNLGSPQLDAVSILGMELIMESRVCREVRLLGRLEQVRSDIGELLQARFGPTETEALRQRMEGIDDLAQLQPLLLVAANCAGLDDFRRALESSTPTPRRRRRR